MLEKKINQKITGFTMIELVVSIAIILMLILLFVTDYHTANRRTDLIMATQNLVANLHLAQNNSLGLVKYNTGSAAVVPAGGWGLSFNTANNTYILFADLNAPGIAGYMQYDPASEGNISYGARVMRLPPGITISNLQTTNSSSTSQVNVTFLPPDPQTNIYEVSNGATSTSLTIQLKEAVNNSIKTVQINFLGLAEVID